ncbi:hypothetical protein BaRGS_00007326 [Batillaria attramentaria]|uniref:C1q domain-containing protein n=1 Tax=Batillaria attramentaria TaxID=370345 RepID=A0ABD0LR89_9CAEN
MEKYQVLFLVTLAVAVLAFTTAFSAGLTHVLNISTPENVTYDRVFLDTTDSYDPTTGVYTVPVSGEYVVFLHGLAEFDGQLYLELYQNSNYILSAYAHTLANYGAASNAAVLPLNKGDEVTVLGKGSSILYGASDEVYTTFSMYLLYTHGPN